MIKNKYISLIFIDYLIKIKKTSIIFLIKYRGWHLCGSFFEVVLD